MPPMFLWELNPAESIFAPLHDESTLPQLPLTRDASEAVNFRHEAGWDSTRVQWDNCAANVVAGSLTLRASWAEALTQAEDLIDHLGRPVWHLQVRAPQCTSFDLKTEFLVETR
jgi:hypothetical protein